MSRNTSFESFCTGMVMFTLLHLNYKISSYIGIWFFMLSDQIVLLA